MDLNATRMFVAVVQAGSLSAAAIRVGIPLPTLSRRIRDLERQLKVQLLQRSARGAQLTDAGMRLYEHAGRGIEALLEAEQAVVSDQARLKGRLRLSLPQTFEPWWELLAAFQRRYPDIQGRAKLATNPAPTGSTVSVNTIGVVRLASSNAPTPVPPTKMTSGASATNSAACLRMRSVSPAVQRGGPESF
jgi:molybdenum-dependent DNA-binding transcriptional regulator ModE